MTELRTVIGDTEVEITETEDGFEVAESSDSAGSQSETGEVEEVGDYEIGDYLAEKADDFLPGMQDSLDTGAFEFAIDGDKDMWIGDGETILGGGGTTTLRHVRTDELRELRDMLNRVLDE